ncbi:response regulator [Blastococcus saxobsidens]|uniref:histidine kinase n=1 Tax=Blastococcus saxobsidens (strain DD2) TaxID=1146883 RepID=H6RP40_BLASD|nr:response regulator [Blastococcus saxobsidens]CCG02701.1 Two-component hybrid sensor and histidine kinase regulator [Blastococcus saxobsidens DD2]
MLDPARVRLGAVGSETAAGSSKFRVLVAVTTLFVAGLTGVLIIDPGSSWSQVVGDLAIALAVYTAAAAFLRAARRRDEAARAWTLMAVAAGVWAAGTTIWTIYGFVLDHAYPFPSLADAGYLSYALPAAAALFAFPGKTRRPVSRIRGVLDGLVIASATLFVSWSWVLGPVLQAGGSGLPRLVAVAYPIVDVVMASLVITLGVRAGRGSRRQWSLLSAGLLTLAVTDSVYVLLTVEGVTGSTGTVLAGGWVTAWLLMALSTYAPVVPRARETTRHFTVTQELLPYVPVLAAVLSAAVLPPLYRFDTFFMVTGVVLVTALVFQQIVVALEKVVLANDLEGLVSARTSELADLVRRNKLILDSTGDGIFGVDVDGRITFANPAACRMLGYEPNELIGRNSHDLLHEPEGTASGHGPESCPVAVALLSGVAQRNPDDDFQRRDGSLLAVAKLASPIVEDERVTGAVVSFRDITERREVDRLKDEFTSVVSHELRTPLTSIRGSLGLLASGALGAVPEKGQRMLDIAVSNTDRLVRLINDILDIERIESGKIAMERQRTAVSKLAAQARDAMEAMAAGAGVTVTVSAVEADLWADPDRMMQTLTNLLSNAIKFSDRDGVVELVARHHGGEVLFSVADQGRGIPADRLEAIFERFQQVDSSDAREKGGTGLGLPICRSIVEQHGGRIWVESTPGQGSTFFFTVPAYSAEPSPPAADAPAVLVCDDDASVRELVSVLLERRGYRAIAAASGEEALHLAAQEQPAAILLDLLMPGLNGWETAARLKEQPDTERIPVVICSVLTPEEATEPAPVGVAGWVDKPLDEQSLLQALATALAPPLQISRVLVIEDDPDLAGVLTTMFAQHGLETFHASTGSEALRLAQRVLPDLLVLDLMLPDTDGFTVVDWLRRHERLHHVPLVVYTAQDLDESQREQLRLGETRFFTKGRISPADFEQRVMGLVAYMTTEKEASLVR